MLCLAIETSCDESAVSLLESEAGSFRVLSEEISSQTKIHEKYGGVVPELASREHLSALPLMLDAVMEKNQCRLADIGLLAVTQGPGLKGCLLIGLGVAKGMACAGNIPIVGVNHIEGHIRSARIANSELSYPYLALVVSGGHTEIVQVDQLGVYKVLARTKDDAAGEAFDKAANLLGLSYPGGAALAALADNYLTENRGIIERDLALPKVMRGSNDFSFSGLKTAIVLLIRREGTRIADESRRAALAAAIQEAIVDTLVHRVEQMVLRTGITRVAVCGGVSANRLLQKRLAALSGITLFVPSKLHCMDNATMIGFVGIERFQVSRVGASNLEVRSFWPVEELGVP